MKAVFIFDTVLVKKDNDYFGMTLTYEFFKNRYLSFYDEITVATRFKTADKVKGSIDGYKITNGENVNVVPVQSYKEIPDSIKNRSKIITELTDIIKNSDKVIIRMPSVLGIFACNICQKLNKEYLIEMVACAWDGYINHTNPIGKLIAPIMYFKVKKCVKNAPKVLYVTSKFLQKRYPTNGNSTYCSDVILEKIDENILDKRLTKIQNMNQDEIKICTVANVGMKAKGHEYVIKAIASLNLMKNQKHYKYYLVGNGNQERLKSIAKKYNTEKDVIFLGSLEHDEVFKILDDIDIYIQPSLQEGLPRSVIEALSRACPVIGSDAGGIPELLNENMMFKRKDSDKIIDILNSMDKNELENMVKYSFERVKEFDFENLNRKRNEFYK